MARIDVYVPDDQLDDAMLVLLSSEVDEADEILDDDRPPVRDRRTGPALLALAAIAFVVIAGPVALVLHWY
jgi:hypothetical protein